MTRTLARLRRPAALLLAAAALPLNPLLAQDTPAADPPAAQTTSPTPQPTAPEPEPTRPAATAAEPAASPPASEAPRSTAPSAPSPRRSTARTPTRSPAATPPPVLIAPAPSEGVPPPVPVETLPVEAIAAAPPAAEPSTVFPEAAPAQAAQGQDRSSLLPWLLLGLAALGALAFFALRRRRGDTAVYRHEQARAEAPVAPVTPPVAAAPVAAAVAGRPEIELDLRPIRAGVSESDARVDFELTVGNSGSAAAQDLRISTWMLAAGSSDAERALVEPRRDAEAPPVTINAGEARTLEASVALPKSEVEGDSVLPVVVADAHYRMPDGSEGHRTVAFAVGVPVEGELAHFDTANPSGLHEGVEARLLG